MTAIPATLGLVVDGASGSLCLLDSGSHISLWPASPNCNLTWSANLRLVSTKGMPIKSFGSVWREVKIDQKLYSFVFIIAEIARPILGMDFLQKFGMSLDLANQQLLHSGTSTAFTSGPGRQAVSGINVISELADTAEKLLARFPEITD